MLEAPLPQQSLTSSFEDMTIVISSNQPVHPQKRMKKENVQLGHSPKNIFKMQCRAWTYKNSRYYYTTFCIQINYNFVPVCSWNVPI